MFITLNTEGDQFSILGVTTGRASYLPTKESKSK